MSAPERIWLKDYESQGKDKHPSEWFRPEVGMTAQEYIRADIHDAAIAAARAEGVREGMLRAAGISDEKAEHLRKCNFKPGGFGPLGGWVGVASDVADRIRAAAEAQP